MNIFIIIIIIYFLIIQLNSSKTKESVNIAIFSSNENNDGFQQNYQIPLRSALNKNNFNYEQDIVHIDASIENLTDDPFNMAKRLCSLIESKNKTVAILSTDFTSSTPILHSIAHRLQMPFIQLVWPGEETDSFQLKDESTLLNIHPEPRIISTMLADIVDGLQWGSFVVLHEDSQNLNKLKRVLELKSYQTKNARNTIIVKQLKYGHDLRFVIKEISVLGGFGVVLDCSTSMIQAFFEAMLEMRLEQNFKDFFLTSLDAYTLDFTNLPVNFNLTTVRVIEPDRIELKNTVKFWERNEFRFGNLIHLEPNKVTTQSWLLYQTVEAVINAINHLKEDGIAKVDQGISCDDTRNSFKFGTDLVSYIKTHGPFDFDNFGRRQNLTAYITEMKNDELIATWNSNQPGEIQMLRDENAQYKAFMRSISNTTIIISSRLEKPYLMYKPSLNDTIIGNERFEGYIKDLIEAIAELIGFDYEIQLTENGEHGYFDKKSETWSGLIGDIVNRKAQLAIADLTITPLREQYVDFSSPFMKLGVDVLYKEVVNEVKLFDFLAPYTVEVWMYIGTLYLSISIALYLVARMAPGDWENANPNDPEPDELENPWDIKNCLYTNMAAIMNQGSDILPKGISSRLTTSMWWLFALIITNSYTASLTAYLTTGKAFVIKDIEDLAKQNKVKYGMVRHGATEEFFNSSTYSAYMRMYSNILLSEPSLFEDTIIGGVKRVQANDKGLYAFLMESTTIEYEVESNCDLRTTKKPIFPRTFGIAMPLNYPYRTIIDDAILKLQENGTLNDLKMKWWKLKNTRPFCPPTFQGSELTLRHVGGVFIVLGVGLVIALLLGIAEFLWTVRKISVDEHVPYWDVFRFEIKFAVNVFVTEKKCLAQKPELPDPKQLQQHYLNSDED